MVNLIFQIDRINAGNFGSNYPSANSIEAINRLKLEFEGSLIAKNNK
jgi:hypothetical protein